MKRNASLLLLYVVLFCFPAYSHSTYVRPAMPVQGESAFIAVEVELTGGANLLQSSHTVAGHKVTVTIPVSPCTDSICPVLYEKVILMLPCGTLPAGICTTITTVTTGSRVEIDTVFFRVYENRDTLPYITGFRVSRYGWRNNLAKSYYYTRNDTLSVVAAFTDQCCAQFIVDCVKKGDTLEIIVLDSGKYVPLPHPGKSRRAVSSLPAIPCGGTAGKIFLAVNIFCGFPSPEPMR